MKKYKFKENKAKIIELLINKRGLTLGEAKKKFKKIVKTHKEGFNAKNRG